MKTLCIHFRRTAGAVSRLIHFGDDAYTLPPPFFAEPFGILQILGGNEFHL
ncbi:hypothetical protein RESH_04705 [Rhodopirellula europaea SH398]|uniref:Uncharacterized protein n=1 Tax=Rhodopirellula europaea SH398 TaxID=1263868 RepID=M5SEX9_9BACT|nr:hypothetical protein RESH_04705 [Rhodopirellula europaea SH398]